MKKALGFSKQIISKYGDITINSNYIVDEHYESAERDIRKYIEDEADVSTQSFENNFRRIPVEYMYIYRNKYPNDIIYKCLKPFIENGKKAIDNIVKIMENSIKKTSDPNKNKDVYTLSAFAFQERQNNEKYT